MYSEYMLIKDKNKILETINSNKFVKKTKFSLLGFIFGRAGLYLALIIAQILIGLYLIDSIWVDSSILFGGSILASVICLVIILNMDVNPYAKLSWSIFIAIFPFPGIILFILAYFDIGHKYEQKRIMKIEEETKDLLNVDINLMRNLKKEDKEFYNIAKYMLNKGNFPTYANSTCKYYPVGEDAFNDMLNSIRSAKDYIFLEYFILEKGYMWGTILEELVIKASQGVEIRLMYDGTNAISRLKKDFPKRMEELGIKVKVFSPIYPIISTYYNNRDHRKIFVVDGKVVFTGGINIADEYINVYDRFGHWKDTLVKIEGMAVESFVLMFLQMWHGGDSERDFEKYIVGHVNKTEGYFIGIGDNPMRKEKFTKNLYLHILNTAKDYAYIMTPYLILDNEMESALCFAAQRGVDVRIVLPGIPDKIIPFLLAKTHYEKLIKVGVKIYEYSPGFMHAKTWLSDDTKTVVGSVNLDFRALYLNFETSSYIYKSPIYKDVYRDFEVVFDISEQINLKDVKKYPKIKKFFGVILKPFAPLL